MSLIYPKESLERLPQAPVAGISLDGETLAVASR